MKLSADFSVLEKLRESIGAKKADFSSYRPNVKISKNILELKLLETGEIILTGVDLEKNLRDVGGLLGIGNTQVTLHIQEPWADLEELSMVPASKPKFHLSECKMISDMRNKNRYNRYVTSNKIDGLFTVIPQDKETKSWQENLKMRAKLLPCIYCMQKLNYRDFNDLKKSQQKKIVNDFTIEDFFEEFSSIFLSLPLYSEDSYPAGGYTPDWAEISDRERRKVNWTCTCCAVDLSRRRGFLDTHHIDGVRGNNRLSNLRVLCKICHANQPNHQHYKRIHEKDFNLIRKLKTEQDIPDECISCK